MEDEGGAPPMAPDASHHMGMEMSDQMHVKSAEMSGYGTDNQVMQNPMDDGDSVSNGNGMNQYNESSELPTSQEQHMDTGMEAQQSAPMNEVKDSFDKMLDSHAEKKEEVKEERDLFGSLIQSATSASARRQSAEEKEEAKSESENDDDDQDDNKDENETKDDDEEESKNDPFSKMLSGESTAEDGTEKKDDDEIAKTSDDAPAATTIGGDALEELEKEEVITITSEKVPDDDKYYEELNAEEKEWLESNCPTVNEVSGKLICCATGKSIDAVIGIKSGVFRHPHLGMPMCQEARKFYGDGDWPRTEDGDEYCRICSQGGDILLCDKCPNAFCKKCISRNLGSRALREITKAEEWACLLCDPKPIYKLKAMYYCVYKNQSEFKEIHEANRLKEKQKKANKRAGALDKEKEKLVKNPQNFLEENISEAFKTLEVYQKALETERVRCIKTVKEGMSVDTATSITRKLRKLYAVTQKNMDLLDRAIVESFVENFPTESTRIHMGRMAPTTPSDIPRVRRPAAQKKKRPQNKIKIKGKKGKKPPPKGKKNTIKINGSAVYEDAYVSKKKRKANYLDDDDIIEVSEDDDFYAPKKKARPGPASKKGKAGPASKKKIGPKSKMY